MILNQKRGIFDLFEYVDVYAFAFHVIFPEQTQNNEYLFVGIDCGSLFIFVQEIRRRNL